MGILTKYQIELCDFLKDLDFDKDIKLGICLCCDTDDRAREMLEYSRKQQKLDETDLLQKAVEISNNI